MKNTDLQHGTTANPIHHAVQWLWFTSPVEVCSCSSIWPRTTVWRQLEYADDDKNFTTSSCTLLVHVHVHNGAHRMLTVVRGRAVAGLQRMATLQRTIANAFRFWTREGGNFADREEK